MLDDMLDPARRALTWFVVHFPNFTKWLYSRQGFMEQAVAPMLPMKKPSTYTRIVLSLFAKLAKIPNVDPTQMQRHRRASSASSQSSMTSPDGNSTFRSRSNSRTSVTRSPLLVASSPQTIPVLDSVLGPALDFDPVTLQRKESRKSTVIYTDIQGLR